jgi:hypothetical protein
VNQFKKDACTILGGAITFDMLNIAASSTGSVSYSIYSGNGGQAFADKSKSICETYKIPFSVSVTSSSDIPTDTKNFWQNGYPAAFGRGGSGNSSYHDASDSITSKFDSLWLAKAVTPGVAIIAEYAVPISGVLTKYKPAGYEIPIKTSFTPSGPVTICITDSRIMESPVVSVYCVDGRLINTIILTKQSNGQYSGFWDYRAKNGYSVAKGLYVISCIIGNDNFRKKIVIGR